jgi:hypothetical protein
MAAITIGNQRETVKDMVLADYQVPKGVSVYKSFWNLNLNFTNKCAYI